jgi:type II secretory pathway predicted ATPase ExeA
MLQQLTAIIATKDEPLLIIDDAHLLKDRVLHLVVLLANSVYGSAGIVIMGDTALRMRIIEGVRTKKPGFEDIYQTIGRRFITMDTLAPTDIPAICRANGIHDDDMIAYICRESSGNLHTATCLIQQHVPQRMAA